MGITPQELSVAIYEITIFIILVFVGSILLYRYRKKRNLNILILALCIFVFSVAPLIHTIDIVYLSETPLWIDAGLGYNLAFALSAYGNILLALFFLRIYQKEKVNLLIAIYAVLNVINTILLINTSIQIAFFANEVSALPYMVSHLALALVLYIYMIISAFRSSQKEIPLKSRRGFQLIGSFGLCLLLAFVFFVMDFLAGRDYSFWVYLGWTMAAVGAIVAYLGYIMPDWLKKRWEIED
jgi:hypothetical protein